MEVFYQGPLVAIKKGVWSGSGYSQSHTHTHAHSPAHRYRDQIYDLIIEAGSKVVLRGKNTVYFSLSTLLVLLSYLPLLNKYPMLPLESWL